MLFEFAWEKRSPLFKSVILRTTHGSITIHEVLMLNRVCPSQNLSKTVDMAVLWSI
jgi:hypothetical protein